MTYQPRGDSKSEQDWFDVVEQGPVSTLILAGKTGSKEAIATEITYANAAAVRLFLDAETADSMLGQSILDFLEGEETVDLEDLLRTCSLGAAQRECNRHPVPVVTKRTLRPLSLHLQTRSAQTGLVAQLTPRNEGDDLRRALAEEQRFRNALMEFSDLAHGTQDDDEFYQRLLERAVEIVPGAQGGSVQLRISGTPDFRFVAAVGFDLVGLQRHTLVPDAFFRDASDPTARIVREFKGTAVRSPEIAEWLETVGRLSEIVVNVSAPALSDGEPIAFLSLDNFEDPEAMNSTSVEMTTVLSQLIAQLWSRRQLEAEIRKERGAFKHLALHDPLTGLANRRSLEGSLISMVEKARDNGHPAAVLFVDVDDFKTINDQLGHAAGDLLLKHISKTLRRAVREGDIVGRWGGDEFVIVPERLDTFGEAKNLAQRILQPFTDAIDLGNDVTWQANVSVGVGWSESGNSNVDTLVRTADGALYEAKEAGKGASRVHTIQ